jgi:hypothetical protein
MNRVSFYINGFRVGWAGIFTGPATHAYLGFNNWKEKFLFIRSHIHCLGGTMFRASPAIGTFGENNTIMLYKYHLAKLKNMLFLQIKWADSSGRAYFAAYHTVEIAIVSMVIKAWLHKAFQAVFKECGLDHMSGACTYAEVTGRTGIVKVLMTQRAWWRYGEFPDNLLG